MSIEGLRFPVEGMSCSSCVGRISRALGKVEGVRGVRVDLGNEMVTVRREPGAAPDAAIAAAIETAGYRARIDHATIVEVSPARLLRLLGR